MALRFPIVLFLCLLSAGVYSQKIDKNWTVFDNERAIKTPKFVAAALQVTPDADISEFLLNHYRKLGYLEVYIDSLKPKEAFLQLGCVYRYSEVVYDSTLASFGFGGEPELQPGDPFIQTEVEREAMAISGRFQNLGFALARVFISVLEINQADCLVKLHFDVEKGERWVSEGMVIAPKSQIGLDYLKRASGYQDSALVTPAYISGIRQKLLNTGFFEDVDEPGIFEADGAQYLYVKVEERNPNSFDGLIGYVPSPEGKGQIAGQARLELMNVFADGNGVDLMFQRIRPEESRLSTEITQKWIAGLPLDLGFGFKFFQQDTNYNSREFRLEGAYQIAPNLKLLGSVVSNSVSSSDAAPVELTETDGRRQFGLFGFDFSTVDRPTVSTRGFRLNVLFGTGTKRITENREALNLSKSRFAQRMLQSFTEAYFPLLNNRVIALSGEFYFIDSDIFTETDLLRFGGANSFRGYAEEQFIASRAGWGTFEFRQLANRDSYVFGFTSAGAFSRPRLLTEPNNQLKTSDFLYSFGFGLSYKTAVGQIRFSYALTPQQDLGNGKVHFSIRTSI